MDRRSEDAGSTYWWEKQEDYIRDVLKKKKAEFKLRMDTKCCIDASPSDYERFNILGSGAFGTVRLVKHVGSNVFYAMKELNKEKIIKLKQLRHTLSEKNILHAIRFPFVVHMHQCFKDNASLYFIMPFVVGGELFSHIRKFGKLDEIHSKFYACQIILALEYLHYCGLVYRDLKPENILLDKNGYVKLTDFGFCKKIRERTWTLCGTPEYLAPEIILSKGYGKSVDWWSFGILVYEMSAGRPPFMNSEPMKIYEKIVAGKYRFPPYFSSDLKDLIYNTLQVDITRRFGVIKNGTMNFKCHRWFREIDWWEIYTCNYTAPFIPKCKAPNDTANYDFYEEEELRRVSENYLDEFKDF